MRFMEPFFGGERCQQRMMVKNGEDRYVEHPLGGAVCFWWEVVSWIVKQVGLLIHPGTWQGLLKKNMSGGKIKTFEHRMRSNELERILLR